MNTGPTLRKNPLGNMPDRSKYSGAQSDAACFWWKDNNQKSTSTHSQVRKTQGFLCSSH